MSEFYNTKFITYKNSMQIKRYNRCIQTCFEVSDEIKEARRRKTDTDERTPEQISQSFEKSRCRTINKIYQIALANEWEYFLTFTFSPKKVNRTDYSDVTKKLCRWIDKTRKTYSPDLKYLLVPELHKKGGYHFHGLLSNIGNLPLVFSGYYSGDDMIFNLSSYDLGFSTATLVRDSDKCCSYILKYITKDLCCVTKNKKRYWASRNLDKPIIENRQYTSVEHESQMEMIADLVTYRKHVDIPKVYNSITIYGLDM